MDSKQLAKEIRKIGREINIETLGRTRELYTPLHPIAPFDGVEIERDISYGEHERNRLDLFSTVENRAQPRPVLVYVHGGGFVRGDKYTPGTPFYDNVGVWAVRNGLIGINITYRLAPEFQWPSGIEDLANAMQWIRINSDKYGIDPARVFLVGQSAGAAHVASYMAHPEVYAPVEHGLAGAVLMSPIVNLLSLQPDEFTIAYFGEDSSAYGDRSSLEGIRRSSVPVMLVTPEREPDFFEDQAIELLVALKERDSRIPRFVHLAGQNHLSGIFHLGLEGDMLGPQLIDFMNIN